MNNTLQCPGIHKPNPILEHKYCWMLADLRPLFQPGERSSKGRRPGLGFLSALKRSYFQLARLAPSAAASSSPQPSTRISFTPTHIRVLTKGQSLYFGQKTILSLKGTASPETCAGQAHRHVE
jgi:hypothetical protein